MIRPDFERYGHIVLNRILPVFDGIGEEACEVERTKLKEWSGGSYFEEDYLDAAEAAAEHAREEALAYYDTLSAMHLATLNLYAAGLYHLTEQHLINLCLQILDQHGRDELHFGQVVEWFQSDLAIDLKALSSWTRVSELRALANSIKHGEGRSAEELRALRPDLFVHPQFRSEAHSDTWSIGRIRKPLFGEDIYLSREEFAGYHVATLTFWDELAAAFAA